MRIVLASNSPRRKELLHQIFDSFDVIKSDFNEEVVDEKNPEELVKVLSLKKAEAVFDKIKDDESELLVIGGDTIVFFENEVLGKPKSEEDAYNTLKRLQNEVNYVYTGLAVIVKKGEEIIKRNEYTKCTVYMKKMSDKEILEYIGTKEPLDKAGSYAVQGIGSKFVEKMEGNPNAAIGLDIEKLEKILGKYKEK